MTINRALKVIFKTATPVFTTALLAIAANTSSLAGGCWLSVSGESRFSQPGTHGFSRGRHTWRGLAPLKRAGITWEASCLVTSTVESI
ncbi:hypothetical protein FN846DRAFT_935518 [Sphaerosporella brunnea]|uniref:Uncharacterized protein n=1 Tax=Sphaerosporella brunnea TaxID=1250544 RepID=A0A5J5F4V0_9PEZI|nr:hypothetical protein FN846DRAFT_935518 [Sphaerosporella brunnea]